MGKIHILPPHIANRIAAGEVVERPASIVKELLENAIDADADSIVVELEDGGKTLIRVRDNGCGIAADDLPLSIERHATSKIQDENGLDAILTLGFRGEALASIGAVAQLSIQSRVRDAELGAFVSIRFGRDKRYGPVGCLQGTTVTVEDLFLEVPGRRRFLKGTQTELGHISMAIRRLAAAHPHIAMELWHGGRRLLKYPPRTGERRLEPLLGDLCETFIPISASLEDYEIEAYIAPPDRSVSNSRSFYFFLNGRPIRDAMLWKAVIEAYKGRLMKDFYPVGGLFLKCKPSLVDVNVHPNKHEVRFAEPDRVYRMVYNLIHNALTTEGPKKFLISSSPETGSGCISSCDGGHQTSSLHIREAECEWYNVLQHLSFQDPKDQPQIGIHSPDQSHSFRIIGQLWDGYIIYETDDECVIVDQHAAHEAIVFRRLQDSLEGHAWKGQQLLMPLIVELAMEQMIRLHEIQPMLQELGIVFEPFGPTQVKISALPDWIPKNAKLQWLFQNLVNILLETKGKSRGQILYERIAAMACEDAVQGGHRLTMEEMRVLITDVLRLKVTNCPHGRPISFHLTKQELERILGRK